MKRLLFAAGLLAAVLGHADGLAIEAPAHGAVVPLLTPAQKAYRAMSTAERREKFASEDFRKNEMGLPVETVGGVARRAYDPQTVRLAWNRQEPCAVRVVAHESGRVFFEATVTGGVCHVEGLEIAKPYDWSVSCGGERAVSQFVTEDVAPRMFADPFVPNVRDFGGWVGMGGRRVRQGLVFRSAGLNDNAEPVRASSEGLARVDPKGRIAALAPAMTRRCAEWQGAKLTFPAVKLPTRWSGVRLPDGLTQLSAAAIFADYATDGALPDGVCGASVGGELADGRLQLGGPGDGRWCAVTGTLEANADGYALLACCADWYWAMSVNGVPVRDYLGGNRRMAADAPHDICVPVRKGANVVRVVVGSGSSDFYFRMAAGTRNRTVKEIVEREVAAASKMVEDLRSHGDGFQIGATRIHEANRNFWLKTLGVRTDIDLRSDRECFGMAGSPLGDGVVWAHVSFSAYGGLVTPAGRQAFAKVFRIFLDRKNYPIDFHCIAGKDRTGSLAYVLNALLGVDENELLLDWEWSGFWNRNPGFSHARLIDQLAAALKAEYPAPTLRESAERYVLAAGFTAEDIATFRNIMME